MRETGAPNVTRDHVVELLALEDAQHQFLTAREQIHTALRRDPFSAEDMRAAMTKTRAARQNFDQTLQGIFAEAASRMSNSGRNALADWPPVPAKWRPPKRFWHAGQFAALADFAMPAKGEESVVSNPRFMRF